MTRIFLTRTLKQELNPPDEVARLISENQGLAFSFARRFKALAEQGDLIAAAKTGLARAAKDYDPNKGKLSTYAWHWMRKYVEKAAKEHIRMLISQNLGPSLNAPLRDTSDPLSTVGEDENTFGDIISDEKATTPLDVLQGRDREVILHRAWESAGLNDDESMVIFLRFGLDGRQPEKQNEIARKMGLTPRRIRQIEKSAMDKFKSVLFQASETHLMPTGWEIS